ncbi:unnamed protein product [Musa banksii]
MGKTRGMGAGRKLKTHRRRQRWADKAYKKSHLGNEWKKPFAGSSHAKGIVLEKIGIEAKQPNSAIRKCARVQLIKNGKKIAAFVPNDGCLNFIEENDEVLIAGFGRKGHAVGDIPGVRFKVVLADGTIWLESMTVEDPKMVTEDFHPSMGWEAPPLHILLFPLMSPGHTLPMVDLAKLLAARGVRTTILTTPANAPSLEAAIELAQRSYQYPIELHVIPFPSTAVGLPEGCENASSVPYHQHPTFMTGVTMLQEPFRRVLTELLPDAAITDWFLPWTFNISEELNIPRLVFHGISFFALCAHASLLFEQLPTDEDTITIPNFPRRVELQRSQMPDETQMHPVFTEIIHQIAEWEPKSYGVVVNSFYELEAEFADHLRNVLGQKAWHVGPVSLCNARAEQQSRRGNKPAIDGEECLKWLGEKEAGSVLYVCFGSMGTFTEAQFRELALGLEASGRPFIWAVKKCRDEWWPERFMARMEGRCLILRGWAPQILILNHAAVGGFVTHCGWNSSLEAVTAGVPMVTWPFFAEQFFNEKLLVEVLKIGVAIGAKQHTVVPEQRPLITAAEIERTVRRLMDDGEEANMMRSRARELSFMAKSAVDEGGSSYIDTQNLIQELTNRRTMPNSKSQ